MRAALAINGLTKFTCPLLKMELKVISSFTIGTMQNFCLKFGSLSANVISANVIFVRIA